MLNKQKAKSKKLKAESSMLQVGSEGRKRPGITRIEFSVKDLGAFTNRSYRFQLLAFSFWLTSFFFSLLAFCFLLSSCSSKPESNVDSSSTKFQQYYLQGEQLYVKNCSNCHQKNGNGLGLLYPPLNKSDFMDGHFEKVICLMTTGIRGALVVNGRSFNKPMPGVPSLTDLEIAEIATYIYNTWDHKRGMVDVNLIKDDSIVCPPAE